MLVLNPEAKLFDQIREVMRFHHYSYRTEKTYDRPKSVFHSRIWPALRIVRLLRPTVPSGTIQLNVAMPANESKTTAGADDCREHKIRPKVIRIKLRAFSSAGHAKQVAHWSAGNGQLIVSGEAAIQAIEVVDVKIARLLNEKPRDLKTLVELMRLKLGFNRQVMQAGQAHLQC